MVLHANAQGTKTPFGASRRPVSGTGCAWDNNDRFVATLSGQNTLNDTVGIFYQPIQRSVVSEQSPMETSENLPNVKRKRAYRHTPLNLEPYHKKPKINKTMVPLNDQRRLEIADFECATKSKLFFGTKYSHEGWMECSVHKSTYTSA